jgi:cyclic beta-1,2-glucan synthetase
MPEAGYIQAYPPGVRENGGQYSHAGVWALMAQAELGTGDLAYRYFTYLSPAHRAAHPTRGAVYAIEPYVMAGDVYSAPPYVGRGGWSWYTGAAAWLHRAAVESIFGLQLGACELSFNPRLPSHWPEAELTLRRDGRQMRFIIYREASSPQSQAPSDAAPIARAALLECGAIVLTPGQPLDWSQLPSESCFVIPLP